jgi:chemotaxis protein histidine kinase CheA
MDPARLPEGIPEQFLLDLYVRSGRDTVVRMREAIRHWTQDGSEADLADARRMAHNLKGSSCQLGFEGVARFAGALELYVTGLLRRRRAGEPEEVGLLEAAADLAMSVLDAIERTAAIPDLEGITTRLAAEPR